MFRIRLHGRGGQGIKTAGRLLGQAFFQAGHEVQDAPRYGAERRGAPIFATVRAARGPINERGLIVHPDLVVVADETLLDLPAAGVLAGLQGQSVLLILGEGPFEAWRARVPVSGPVLSLSLPGGPGGEGLRHPGLGGACGAGAAARLTGVIARVQLEAAIRIELSGHAPEVLRENLNGALAAFDRMSAQAGVVREGGDRPLAAMTRPEWIDLPCETVGETAGVSAPDVFAAGNSVEVRTGLWRAFRPAIDAALCKRCTWVCGTLCPDGVIAVAEGGAPRIDYDHCKGCLVCLAVCPSHAIGAIPEAQARRGATAGVASPGVAGP